MRRIAVLLLFFLVGCASQSQAVVHELQLPTLVALPTSTIDLQEPARIATAFLGAWQTQDFAVMYSLLSFSTQETITQDVFQTLYLDTQDTMTFDSVSFEAVSMIPGGSRTAQLSYNVTFQTRLLGEIQDDGRTLTVILDPQTGTWRVAWTTGDIFTEFASGARLEFQANASGRSNIYARDGEIIADMQGRMVEVYVVQGEVDNWELCRSSLIDVVGVRAERLDQIFASAQLSWSTRVGLIERQNFLDNETRLENDCDATFQGVPIRRYHPNGSVMPHVLGYVGLPSENQVDDLVRQGFNAETIIGQAGIEQSWNDVLMGTPGGRLQIINADGTRARILAEVASEISESIWLTIDLGLQQYIIDTLNTAYLQSRFNHDGSAGWGTRSPGAAAIVMNVNTGEILAMVSYPTFDANAYTTFPAIGREIADEIQATVAEDARNPILNRATQGTYPAGSIFKVIDAIAVLDTGVYDENTVYFCNSTWENEGDVRYDWLGYPGHGTVTTRTALMQSCNPFFYETGFTLNNADPFFLPNYARRMGLGDFTGLTDLPENSGFVNDPDTILQSTGVPWNYSNAVNLSIGQAEVNVTPLQMVRIYAAIANGGDLMQPYLVNEQGILNQRTSVAEPTVVSNINVSEDTLRIVRSGLCDVTTQNLGTASHIFRDSPLLDTVGVCGKTGTAQAGPVDDLPFSWFASYAPAEEPEIAVIVMVENAGDGSAIAAPISKLILEYYFFLADEE